MERGREAEMEGGREGEWERGREGGISGKEPKGRMKGKNNEGKWKEGRREKGFNVRDERRLVKWRNMNYKDYIKLINIIGFKIV